MNSKIEKLKKLTQEQWEGLCQRCARCCYEKIDFNGHIFYTRIPCDQLDLETQRCQIYNERDQVRTDCQRLTPEVVEAGILPADCPYALLVDDYVGPSLGTETSNK
ncbi:hypothetical protein [Geopsychrobacter electrodiphilus]|uniref:hypothetical protein n=1 Tax=Geopsychrobacter electrodiphilus TaxID=225196 RepID=UPI00036ED0AF|nr:hypothetical protein [Geopsychrobacter electrodiphilus]